MELATANVQEPLRASHVPWKSGAARYITHAVGLEVHRIAPCFFIANKKCVLHQLQVGNKDLLNIFFHPRLYGGMENFRSPHLLPCGGIRCYDILLFPIALCGVADSVGYNRSNGFWRQAFCKGNDRHACQRGATDYDQKPDPRHLLQCNCCSRTIRTNAPS